MKDTDDILFSEHPAKSGKLAVVTLNRPQVLNALSDSMFTALYEQLQIWATDPSIGAVLIRGAGEKAFCAGGDLKQVYNNGPENYKRLIPSFSNEYKLVLLISEYPKPYIAMLHGIAMGGGLGISLHGSRIIATETLKLAMPETIIGFFPDVGASKFLSQCPYNLGIYLGLTGSSINVNDALYCKLVDAYIPQSKLEQFFNKLLTIDLLEQAAINIDTIIEVFKEKAGPASLKEYKSVIEECFGYDDVIQVIRALETLDTDWSVAQAALLHKRSPTSLKATLKQLQLGSSLSLKECITMEFNLAINFFQQKDIYEGIRAAIIDKTFDPKWSPATLSEVSDAKIQEMFEIKCTL